MTVLHIHGTGTCSMGTDEEFTDGIGRLQDVPIKEFTKPALRRRYGRVTKLMYAAASRALAHAGIEDASNCSLVTCTAMGEVNICLDLLCQIHDTNGARISPALVPNSVHNAPAGHLTIGLANRRPAITISQGWLSAEAGVSAARDLLAMGAAEKALLVVADEADPGWTDQLAQSTRSDWADQLKQEAFQEGAVALVLGNEPGGKQLGTMTGGVERSDDHRAYLQGLQEKYRVDDDRELEARGRIGAGGDMIGRVLDIPIDGPGLGTSQAGTLAILLDRMKDPSCRRLLLLGKEIDEVGYVYWAR